MGTGAIEVHRRPNVWADRLRAYAILIDGEKVDEIRRGETKALTVDAGAHTVQFKLDWGTSVVVPVEVRDGATVRVECFARNPLAALYYSTAGRKRYIGVAATDG